MVRLLAIAGLPLALVLVSACSGSDDNGTSPSAAPAGTLKVITTVAPITSIAENIAGTKAQVTGLIPEGQDSHTFEPPPSAAKVLSDADLIVVNGLKLEEPTLEMAQANKKSGAVILEVGTETITPEQYKYDFSFPESGGKPNPHLWPNPQLTENYAKLVHKQMVKLDPTDASYYDANYAKLKTNLEKLDQQMKAVTQTVPEQNRKLVTYHDSWAYWAPLYGFTVIGAIQPADFAEPSASEVASLIDQIKEEKVPAIFGSEVFPSDILQQIADETGATYVDKLRDDDLPGAPGDELHSYIGLMVENMRIMIPALGGDASAINTVDTKLVFTDGPSPADYPQ